MLTRGCGYAAELRLVVVLAVAVARPKTTTRMLV